MHHVILIGAVSSQTVAVLYDIVCRIVLEGTGQAQWGGDTGQTVDRIVGIDVGAPVFLGQLCHQAV